MFKLFGVFATSMMMIFTVMAACPEKCNNSCGQGECAVSVCGCDDSTTNSETAGNDGKCTRFKDSKREASQDSEGGLNTDANVDVNKN